MRLIAGMKVYDDPRMIRATLRVAVQVADEVWVGVSDKPWRGEKTDNSLTLEYVSRLMEKYSNIRMFQGSWDVEEDHINAIIGRICDHEIEGGRDPFAGDTFYWYLDADETFHVHELQLVKERILSQPEAVDYYNCSMVSYIKHGNWVVDPPEPAHPGVFFKLKPGFRIVNIRSCDLNPQGIRTLPPSMLVMHHVSYVGTDDEIYRKITSFTYSHQISRGWFEDVYLPLTPETAHDFHPTHPECWKRLKRIDTKQLPKEVLEHPEDLLFEEVSVQ